MARSSISSSAPRSTTFIAFALTIAMLYFGRQIFIPLALALVLAFLLAPLVGLLEKGRLHRTPSVIIVLILSFAATAGVSWGVANQLLEIMVHVGEYKANLQEKVSTIRAPKSGPLQQATQTVRQLNKDLSITVDNSAQAPDQAGRSSRSTRPLPVQVTAPNSGLIQDLTDTLGPLAPPLETAGIVVIFTAFTLIKKEDLRNRLIRLGGKGRLHVMTQALDDASRRLSRYLWMQFVVNVTFGSLFGLSLYFIGIPHALLWAALAALLRFVPYIGTWIAAALPVTLALAIFPGWKHAVLAFMVFAVLELITANILEPWIYGSHTGISSLAILVAAVFWTMLWGVAGLILSTPLTLCLMLAGRYVPRLDFLEIVLGDEPVLTPEERFYQRLLAMDVDDARDIAEAYLREHPLESLYESVILPALALAEQDRHSDFIDERTSDTILQNTRELIEDLGDRYERRAARANAVERGNNGAVLPMPSLGTGIVCIPARDEADELAGIMLAQLLRLGGFNASYVSVGSFHDATSAISNAGYSVACVSALPPFAVARARSMCQHLQSKFPQLKIAIGLWLFAGGPAAAHERLQGECREATATTLTESIGQIRRLVESSVVHSGSTRHQATSH